jgi:two-component system sensor histidine kinase LytS
VFDIDEQARGCLLPPLILQPLVENALKHGILPQEEGGDVVIGAHHDNGVVRIEVRDNGVGITPERLATLFNNAACAVNREGSGIALKNVNARLVACYGAEHALHIESSPGEGTMISFTVPNP